MNTDVVLLISGWSAYLSAGATILTFVTGILFFSVGAPFGKINDVSSVFQLIFILPLVFLFLHLLTDETRALGVLSAVFGIVGLVVSGYGQILLVIGKIDFERSTKYFPAGAAIGIWLILTASLTLSSYRLPSLLVLLGTLGGIGYITTVVGFLRGGQKDVLFYVGAVVLGTCYPAWAVWLGRLVFSDVFVQV